MQDRLSRQVVVAGGGIAGLTAALAFARRGFFVRLFEQAQRFEPFGAGLQLSPNATRILDRLGVLDLLRSKAVRPDAILLRDAASLRVLARVPLGAAAERRWHAPYLVAHRADVHEALVEKAAQDDRIEVVTGARITGDVAFTDSGVTVTCERNGQRENVDAGLLIGADGVWSALRAASFPGARRRFSGSLAWRATAETHGASGEAFAAMSSPDCVTAFLDPDFHLVAYPVSGGAALNLVAFANGDADAEGRTGKADLSTLTRAVRHAAPALSNLLERTAGWTVWPLNTVDQGGPWTRESLALIGDAAHAMTPFAAQGAAMAIEDAATLASFAAASTATKNLPELLREWEQSRKARVAKVARRGALNKLAWNAAGPLAFGRDLLLRLRSPESLAADLDWLYGYEAIGSRQSAVDQT
jgi:salicylate hydroxylase